MTAADRVLLRTDTFEVECESTKHSIAVLSIKVVVLIGALTVSNRSNPLDNLFTIMVAHPINPYIVTVRLPVSIGP